MSRQKWVWTRDRVAAVQASVRPKITVRSIAREHGLTPGALKNAIRRGIINRPPVYRRRETAKVIEIIPRTCSGCGHAFNASIRFIRLCNSCREKGCALGDWSLSIFDVACCARRRIGSVRCQEGTVGTWRGGDG